MSRKFTLNPRIIWNRYVSRKPWMEFTTDGVIKDGMVKLEFDWNTAFINELRKNGFTGMSEEEIVESYMSSFTKELHDPEVPEPAPISSAHPKLSKDNVVRIG